MGPYISRKSSRIKREPPKSSTFFFFRCFSVRLIISPSQHVIPRCLPSKHPHVGKSSINPKGLTISACARDSPPSRRENTFLVGKIGRAGCLKTPGTGPRLYRAESDDGRIADISDRRLSWRTFYGSRESPSCSNNGDIIGDCRYYRVSISRDRSLMTRCVRGNLEARKGRTSITEYGMTSRPVR